MGLDSFSEIERRIKRIEAVLGISDDETPAAPRAEASRSVATPAPATGATNPTASRAAPATRPAPVARPSAADGTPASGLFLGAIAALCLLLAAVLMVRLAIESGWLTPARQIWITALFGSLCVATGFVSFARDRPYLAILPGLGVAVLNLAVYGAAFVHSLVGPGAAAVGISAISLLCLALFFALEEDLYLVYAVLGTHVGAVLISGSAPSPEMPLAALLAWNLVFAPLSIRGHSRRLLSIAAYSGFAAVYFVGRDHPAPAALVQALLFFVYLTSTLQYSRRLKAPLTEGETWTLFPPLLIFYVTEYAWLSRILGPIAPYLFLGLAGLVWFAYVSFAREVATPLASGRLVYLFLGGTVLHAFFFQIVPDGAKPLAGLLIAGAILARRRRLDFRGEHFGLQILAIATGLGGFLMALFDLGNDDVRFAILNGVVYGVGLLHYALSDPGRNGESQIRDFAVALAHLQWMTALYRARVYFGVEPLSLVVTGLWVAYAFAVFALGWGRRFAWVCRSCLFILAFCVLKLMVYDVWNQSAVVRIVSLAGLGIALYAFGFLLRRVAAWSRA